MTRERESHCMSSVSVSGRLGRRGREKGRGGGGRTYDMFRFNEYVIVIGIKWLITTEKKKEWLEKLE